jgi:hypothetical protein
LRGGPFEAKEETVGLRAECDSRRESKTAMCELRGSESAYDAQ